MCPKGKYPHEKQHFQENLKFDLVETNSSIITDVTSIKPFEILNLIEESIKF